jgi:hypothetical protein
VTRRLAQHPYEKDPGLARGTPAAIFLKPSDLFVGLLGLTGVLVGALLARQLERTRLVESHKQSRQLQSELLLSEQLARAAEDVISLSVDLRS